MSAPQRPPEAVIARLRPHGRALILPTAVLLVDTVALIVVLGILDRGWDGAAWLGSDALRIVALGLAGLLAIVGFVVPVLRYLTRTLTVTSRRVVVRSGFLFHSRDELLHSSGYRVSLRRGPLQALLRSGDVVLEVGGDHRVTVRDVPQALLVQAALTDLVDEARPRFPPPDRTPLAE